MGKIRQKRKLSRSCPIGLMSIKDEEKEELIELPSERYRAIFDQLQNTVIDERESAAFTIAHLVSQKETVESMLKADVVKIVGPLLVDPSYFVRHTVVGALRNMSVSGHDVCLKMIDQDVLTPLIALLRQYNVGWMPAKKSGSKIDSKKETFIHAVNLLCNLCESSEIAVSIFKKYDLLSILLPCLDVNVYGLQVCIAVAQCLYTVSEDNSDVISHLSKSTVLELIHSLIILPNNDSSDLLLRTLATGLMLNIHFGQLENCPSETKLSILKTIVDVSSVELCPILQSLAEILLIKKGRYKHKNEIDIEQKELIIESTMCQLSDLLTALHFGLEILTNLCNCEDETDSWENTSISSDSDGITNESMEYDESTEFHNILVISSQLREVISSQSLLSKVSCFAAKLNQEISSALQSYSQSRIILKRIHEIRCRALLCCNNIIQCLDIEEMGGYDEVYRLWSHLTAIAFKETDIKDIQLLEGSTSASRAVLQKLSERKLSHNFQKMTEADIQLLIHIGQQCSDSGVKINIFKILAMLSNLIDNSCNDYLKIIKAIGLYLLEASSKDIELHVSAEALDSLFDVFSEDHLDSVAQEIMLVNKLKHYLPSLKAKITKQKKTLGEHYPIIMTTQTNLIRFIQYKSKTH